MAQKIIVVGAGIIGANAAYQLQKAGADVTVIDAGTQSATQASFGWINASYYKDTNHFALRAEGIKAYHDLGTELRLPIEWCGCLSWEVTGAELEAQLDELRALGYAVEAVDAKRFAAMEPKVANAPDRALFFPQEGAASSAALRDTTLCAAISLGARLLDGVQVDALRHSQGKIVGIDTSYGPIEADQVLIAAGTQTQNLLATGGVALPMVTRPALMVHTKPVAPILSRILVSELGETRQLADGSIMIPAAVSHQSDASETLNDDLIAQAEQTLARLQVMLPSERLELAQARVAYRPMPEDELPVVGTATPGLYVATMHSGLTLGALMGEVIAADMLGQSSERMDTLLAPYRPDRFTM